MMAHLYSIKTRKTFIGYEKPSLDDFYHHGILGMKWGKRNGPPYPLKAGAHSAGEKAAGYKKSIGGGRNEELYDHVKKPSATIQTAKKRKNYSDSKKEITSLRDQYKKDTDKIWSDYDNNMDSACKKQFGCSYEEAFTKAAKQNSDLDSGKLKYKDSMWAKLNTLEDKEYSNAQKKIEEYDKKFESKYDKIVTDFLDDYFQDHNSLSYKDLEGMGGSRTYNYEHEEYDPDWEADRIISKFSDDPRYKGKLKW